jgi:hypothetical protein
VPGINIWQSVKHREPGNHEGVGVAVVNIFCLSIRQIGKPVEYVLLDGISMT